MTLLNGQSLARKPSTKVVVCRKCHSIHRVDKEAKELLFVAANGIGKQVYQRYKIFQRKLKEGLDTRSVPGGTILNEVYDCEACYHR